MIEKKPRPKDTEGKITKVPTGCGNMYVTLGRVDSELFEVFSTLGKAGGCAKCLLEGLTRSVTLGLRCGIPVEMFVDQLSDLRCPNPHLETLSCVDGIAKVMEGKGE